MAGRDSDSSIFAVARGWSTWKSSRCRYSDQLGSTARWSCSGRWTGSDPVRVTFWGVRGSVPVTGPAAAGFGGNTSCVQVTADDGTQLILDAGTGIRALGLALAGRAR